jgi:hypothetical protein
MKIVVFFFCVFMGITAISLGIGAAYPPINMVARPFVCPSGKMAYQRTVNSPLPGTTYIQASWTCVDPSGRTIPINKFTVSLCAGSFHGILLYVFGWILFRLRRKGEKATAPPARA